MHCRSIARGETPGTFQRDRHITPREFGRIWFCGDADFATVDHQMIVFDLNLGVQPTMDAVILQKMGIGFDRAEIIDGDNLDIIALVFENGTKNASADPAKSVDCHRCRHGSVPLR